jgi:membrane protein
MNALMRAVNNAYDLKETRSFVVQRVIAVAMILLFLLASLLVVGLLVLGPVLSGKVGDWTGWTSAMGWIWWTAQWPILLGGLLLVFAVIYVLAPDRGKVKIEILAPGTVLAVVVWLVASGAFSVYVAKFSSYNKTWGSLAAVIVLMTWLWLSSVAILLGAEVNAEREQSRGTIPDHRERPPKAATQPDPAPVPPAAPAPAPHSQRSNGRLRAPEVALTGVLAAALWALRGRASGE